MTAAAGGTAFGEVVRSIEEGRFPRLSMLRPEIPPALIRIVERCLQRAKADRYPSAIEMLGDVLHVAAAIGAKHHP